MNRPWTREGLAALYALSVAGSTLGQIAEALGRMKSDCDQALWVMLGRAPDEALAVLGGEVPDAEVVLQAHPGSPNVVRFLRENFP